MNIQYKDVAAHAHGVSDATIDAEDEIMTRYLRCEAAYRDALAELGRNSYFYHDKGERLQAFNDFAHDECPDPDSWKEKLGEVR